jgi:tellurium resistance protein TerD
MSSISLEKGDKISLTKVAPKLKEIFIGLGWDVRKAGIGELRFNDSFSIRDSSRDQTQFDLDACVFMLNSKDKVRSNNDFIFFNNRRSNCRSVEHLGDNVTGAGEGDDEVIKVELDKVPADIQKLVVYVTIYEAESRSQHFGMVDNAFIRIVNQTNLQEVTRYNLAERVGEDTGMIFGEVYRQDGEWQFEAIGRGDKKGLLAIAQIYGVDI